MTSKLSSQSDPPRVSVVMSVYNGLPYLHQAVESVLGQTFMDFEFIIIDDGSTDGSGTVLDEYAARDSRVRVVHQDNVGLTVSLNRGIQQARAPLIARMDADDVSMPNRLHRLVEAAGTHPTASLVTSNRRVLYQETGRSPVADLATRSGLASWLLLFYNYLGSHGPAMLRTDLLRDVRGYDESVATAQDYDLWTRLVEKGEVVILEEPLYVYRVHDKAISATRAASQARSLVSISQRTLRDRLGLELTEEEVQLVQRFWLGGWSAPYATLPHPSEATRIHGLLRAATRRFSERVGNVPEHHIRQSVGARFADWAASLGIRRVKEVAHLVGFAVRWDPLAVRPWAGRWLRRQARRVCP